MLAGIKKTTMKNTVIVVLVLIAAAIFVACMWRNKHNPKRENFGETLGMLEPQRKYYSRCVSECHRQHDGDFQSTYAHTQLLCHQKCTESAEDRVRTGQSDIHTDQHSKNHEECAGHHNKELCHCMQEVKKWCASERCPYSKDPQGCQSECELVNSYKCTSGLSWSWRP